MRDNQTLYRSVMELVWTAGVRFHDLRCQSTFVWAIVGLLLTHTISLPDWATQRPGKTQAASRTRQLSRWVHNPKIKPAEVYHDLVTASLVSWREHTVYLALDTSSLWDRFTIVRVSLIYRGRALPLAWSVVASPSVSLPQADYQAVLQDAAQWLPLGSHVVLLADRGFNQIALFRFIRQELGWHLRLRVKRSLWVYRPGKRRTKLGRLLPRRGHTLLLAEVRITAQQLGPVHLALAHVQTKKGYQEWAILSDEPVSLETFGEYGLRFDIEENFLDDKSAGFQLASSELADADALSRLLLLLATATLYLVSTGTAVVARGWRPWVDAHWFRGLSYFQLGWRWIAYALSNGRQLVSFLWLEPGADPEPAIASLRQAVCPLPLRN